MGGVEILRIYLDSTASTLLMGIANRTSEKFLKHYSNTHSLMHFGAKIATKTYAWVHERMLELDNYSSLHTYAGQGHTPFSNMIFESEYTSEFLYDIVCLDEENYLLGDINNDGLINILDVVLIINLILGLSEPTENEVVISDINQDGIINILDIVLLVNMILSD